MILDSSKRYVVAAAADRLARYDRRWRRTTKSEPFDGDCFEAKDGNGHLLCIHTNLVADGPLVRAAVYHASDPVRPVAMGTYDRKWRFEGRNQAWQYVPEYLLVELDGRMSLLRIADHAEFDPLEVDGLASVNSVVALEGSRLVLLAGNGEIHVYDPVRRLEMARFELAGGVVRPTLRVASGGDILWVDDVDTLLQIDTRSWQAIDAAGSESPGDVIVSWSLSANEHWVAVARRSDEGVLLLEARTLLPTAQLELLQPVDQVLVLDDREVFGFREDTCMFFRPRTTIAVQ